MRVMRTECLVDPIFHLKNPQTSLTMEDVDELNVGYGEQDEAENRNGKEFFDQIVCF